MPLKTKRIKLLPSRLLCIYRNEKVAVCSQYLGHDHVNQGPCTCLRCYFVHIKIDVSLITQNGCHVLLFSAARCASRCKVRRLRANEAIKTRVVSTGKRNRWYRNQLDYYQRNVILPHACLPVCLPSSIRLPIYLSSPITTTHVCLLPAAA